MARVTGIGGFFFRARDPDALNGWYGKHFDVRARHRHSAAAAAKRSSA